MSIATSIQKTLALRSQAAQAELAAAIAGRQWSKVAGYHGIAQGLAAAARDVAAEGLALVQAAAPQALAARFAANAADCDARLAQAVAEERFNDVAAHDGVGTGWLMAKKAVQEELRARR